VIEKKDSFTMIDRSAARMRQAKVLPKINLGTRIPQCKEGIPRTFRAPFVDKGL
jgi:hypothetical protein